MPHVENPHNYNEQLFLQPQLQNMRGHDFTQSETLKAEPSWDNSRIPDMQEKPQHVIIYLIYKRILCF